MKHILIVATIYSRDCAKPLLIILKLFINSEMFLNIKVKFTYRHYQLENGK